MIRKESIVMKYNFSFSGYYAKELIKVLQDTFLNSDSDNGDQIICGNDPRIIFIFHHGTKVKILYFDTPNGPGGDPPKIVDYDIGKYSMYKDKVVIPIDVKNKFTQFINQYSFKNKVITSSLIFK
jgi:hypothetical protein